jgi:integrase
MAAVFDWAIAHGHRTMGNPVAGISKGLGKRKRAQQKKPMAAITYRAVPEFIQRLRADTVASEPMRLAFEFLVLTAGRAGEIRGARWSEIDWEARTWVVPAERMKMRRQHRVALSSAAMAILRRAKELSRSDVIFPGRNGKKPIGENAFMDILRRLEYDATAHGMRSCFSTWARESRWAEDLRELALAHGENDQSAEPYLRDDLLEPRRPMMEAWVQFCTGQ